MRLNMNYSLLTEKAAENYRIPSYKPVYTEDVYTESYMMQIVAEFNQEIRESRYFINELCKEIPVDESASDIIIKISEGVKTAIQNIIKGLTALWDKITTFISTVIDKIKEKIVNKKDTIEEKYKYHERTKLLDKALKEASDDLKTIYISDINPTNDLMNKSFPNTSIIESKLVKMVRENLSLYCVDRWLKQGDEYEDDARASESLADVLDEEKTGMLSEIFGKYSFDSTDVLGSAKLAAVSAFGSTEGKDTKIDLDLYGLACDNLERGTDIIKSLEEINDKFKSAYKPVITELNNAEDFAAKMMKDTTNEYDIDMNKKFNESAHKVATNINRILNVVQNVVNAASTLLNYKIQRANQIFALDSYKVKATCHRLIRSYVSIEDGETPETVKESTQSISSAMIGGYKNVNESKLSLYEDGETISGIDECYDARSIRDEFDSAMVMIEEAFLEQEYQILVEEVLLEDGEQNNAAPVSDGGNAAGNAQSNTQNAQPANNQQPAQQNVVQKATNVIKNVDTNAVINKIMQTFTETFNKFSNRVGELSAQGDAKFWNTNSQKISGTDFSKVTVDDWNTYDHEALKKSTIILKNFDPNDPSLADDKTFQDAILKNLDNANHNHAQDDEKDSFSQKVSKRFYDHYIEKGKATELGAEATKNMFAYCDDFIKKGFNGETLGGVKGDYNIIDTEYKAAKRSKNELLNKMKTEAPAADQNQQQNTQAQTAQPAKNESFNLADQFGLVQNRNTIIYEAINGVPNLAGDDATGGADDGNKTAEKELNAKLNRYFKYNTYAITAKMTAALSAYKQYMNVYKAAFKAPKKQNNAETGEGNANNNQQNNQQQSEQK